MNLSDRFAEPLREKLQEEADDVETRVREVTVFRDKAAALWAKASEPIDIGRNTWLEFNPVGIVAGPVRLIDDGQCRLDPAGAEGEAARGAWRERPDAGGGAAAARGDAGGRHAAFRRQRPRAAHLRARRRGS